LYLQKIMLEKTDENHPLSLGEIIELLAGYGIQTERKALYDDLQILETFGLDICRTRSSTVRYFVGSRDFEIPELKLLVDAIQSAKFITHSKSLRLIKKLEGLVSENDGKQLQREVVVTNRVKTFNEQIYYNVDEIHNAIAQNKKISFRYMKWQTDFSGGAKIVRAERHAGIIYIISPFALCWDDENYYLVGFDSEAEIIKHFRVDKMEKISIIDSERDGTDRFECFNPAHYAKSVFSMFGGEECEVTLSVANELIGVIVDRFGADVFIRRDGDSRFLITVSVVLSPQFYAWLFGLETGVRIVSPQKAIEEYKTRIGQLEQLY
jgi:predicted DNA-binding transcriptional regulator YafY